ncbi:MAG TPA: type VI secretion system tube protein TssD [Chitinophagales bacterium]|nr:type VI secretion system tube protein TssD [Chitinophagales bacterium]
MSFKAEFEVGGKKRRVLHCSYSLQQDVDATGRPSSNVKGGQIQLEVESTSDSSLAEWMSDPYKHQDGKITFMKRDSEQKMKEINFKEGYVVSYTESFTNIGDNPMTEHFVISAKEITVGNAEHKNEWPE